MVKNNTQSPYGSAADLPSFAEMSQQIKGMKLLTSVIGRQHRAEVLRVEQELRQLIETVDRFYSLLGKRNWVFHDHLSIEEIKSVMTANATPELVELGLIAIYQTDGVLESLIRHLYTLPELRIRRNLIEKALADYRSKRFYASVLLLITIMDGFVNDIETERRRGLHARDSDELVAWDSVVGHHLGLSHAHASFVASTRKTTSEETFELQRNGIVHGTILNYDNEIVATKAWNRLFAVADWAFSLEKRDAPTEPEPTIHELMTQLSANAKKRRILAEWTPYSLKIGDEEFDEHPVKVTAAQFLNSWSRGNYGAASQHLPKSFSGASPNARAGETRQLLESYLLSAFEITYLEFVGIAACEVEVRITVNGSEEHARMRWIHETSDGNAAISEVGKWMLYTWTPWLMIKRAT